MVTKFSRFSVYLFITCLFALICTPSGKKVMTTPRAVGDAQSTALNATRHNNHKIGLVLALYNANVTTDWKTVALAASKIPIRAIVPVKQFLHQTLGGNPRIHVVMKYIVVV